MASVACCCICRALKPAREEFRVGEYWSKPTGVYSTGCTQELTTTICLSMGVWCRWALSQGQDFIANNQVPQIDFATFHRYVHQGMCFMMRDLLEAAQVPRSNLQPRAYDGPSLGIAHETK